MSESNPYESPSSDPSSASASTTTSNERPKKTSVLLVILLQFITAGFYAPYWYTSRRKVLNRLGGNEDTLNFPEMEILEINLGLCIAAFVLNFINVFGPLNPDYDSYLGFVLAVNLSYGIALLVLAFKAKGILEANYNADFSGIITFFLQIVYLQYKINNSELLDEAQQELPASVLGLR